MLMIQPGLAMEFCARGFRTVHPQVVGVGGSAASARVGVWMGKTLESPDRWGVVKLKRRQRRARYRQLRDAPMCDQTHTSQMRTLMVR